MVIRVAPIYYHDGAQTQQILSPRSISNKEESLVRELVASSTYESGCLKPIATTTHTAETLRVRKHV